MSSLLETLPYLAAYHASLLALAILCVTVLLQALLTAPLAFVKNEEAPGVPLKGDHSKLSFRVVRTHSNSVESLPAFIGILMLAILAGVDATWVNWLAGLHVAFRLLFWLVYYSGVGAVAGGPRTLSYLGGWLTNLILAGMTFYALLR